MEDDKEAKEFEKEEELSNPIAPKPLISFPVEEKATEVVEADEGGIDFEGLD